MNLPLEGMIELREKVAKAWARDLAAAEAARAAFYLSLASFPAVKVLFSLAGLLGSETALEGFVRAIAAGLPQQAADVLVSLVRDVKVASSPGLLSLSAVLTLLWASSVVESLALGIERAYRVEKRRGWWRLKAIALLLLVVNSVFLVGGAIVVVAGPRLALALGLEVLAGLLSWPLIWAVMTLELWTLYYVLPAPEHSRNGWCVLAGAVAGTGLGDRNRSLQALCQSFLRAQCGLWRLGGRVGVDALALSVGGGGFSGRRGGRGAGTTLGRTFTAESEIAR